MNILGVNAYHANASAAIVCDGQLVAAVEEERFNRVKYAAGFPAAAVRYCLKEAGLTLAEIDHVAVPRNPFARLGTKLAYAVRMPSFARERLKVLAKFTGMREALARAFDADPAKIGATFHRVEHHLAHLASTFYCSPFEEAALLSADGLGDFASSMWGAGFGPRMNIHGAITFPHSLGLYYSGITQYLGFLKFGDEYKVMGLAAYGQPEYLDTFRKIVKSNGTRFALGLEYFIHHRTGPEMSWAEADKTPSLGRLYSAALARDLGPARNSEELLEARHRNIAASLQARLEEVYVGFLRRLGQGTRMKSVCLAGGVAFNCVANGKILDSTPFEKVYVHPRRETRDCAWERRFTCGIRFSEGHDPLRWTTHTGDRDSRKTRCAIAWTKLGWFKKAARLKNSPRKIYSGTLRTSSLMEGSWAGFRDARNGDLAPWETAASLRTRGALK